MKKTPGVLSRIGLAGVSGFILLAAIGAEPAKPLIEIEDLVGIVEGREWDYLNLQWTTDGGDHVTEGPEIIIMRREGKWIQLFRPVVLPAVKLERSDLSAEQAAKFTSQLGEFMILADKEVDFIESLRGLAEREKQARMNQMMKETGAFGIGAYGYSLELRQGGQTLKTADAFAGTMTMLKWMRSQKPKADEKR